MKRGSTLLSTIVVCLLLTTPTTSTPAPTAATSDCPVQDDNTVQDYRIELKADYDADVHTKSWAQALIKKMMLPETVDTCIKDVGSGSVIINYRLQSSDMNKINAAVDNIQGTGQVCDDATPPICYQVMDHYEVDSNESKDYTDLFIVGICAAILIAVFCVGGLIYHLNKNRGAPQLNNREAVDNEDAIELAVQSNMDEADYQANGIPVVQDDEPVINYESEALLSDADAEQRRETL